MNTTDVSQDFISAEWSEEIVEKFKINELREIILSKKYLKKTENSVF